MKTLSVVIPTYNMEQYLSRCLDSVLNENILEDLEVIVVNDGSKDGSLKIARSYQDKFGDSLLIIDKENGNYGSCVNAAMDISTCKYFRILDADDYFSKEALFSYIGKLKELDADMVLTGNVKRHINGKIEVRQAVNVEYGRIYKKEEIDFCALKMASIFAMHSITYRTSLLKECNLRMQHGVSYTDTEFCFFPYWFVRKIVFLPEILYNYMVGHEGQTIAFDVYYRNREQMRKVLFRLLENFSLYKDSVTEQAILNTQREILIRLSKMYYLALLVFSKRMETDMNELQTVENKLREIDLILYNKVGNIKYHHVKIVSIWRRTSNYPDIKVILYRFMDRIIGK